MKIVSHKVAKLARKKEFNETVFAHYGDNGILGWTSGKLNYPHNIGCAAPSLYSLQNWLLTTHNIWVEPILNFVPDTMDDYGFRVCIYTNIDQWNNVKWATNKTCSKIYKSPWEALDEGLYQALLMI